MFETQQTLTNIPTYVYCALDYFTFMTLWAVIR